MMSCAEATWQDEAIKKKMKKVFLIEYFFLLYWQKQDQQKLVRFCGESGIRTHDTLLEYTHFPGVLLRPLGHLSGKFSILKFKNCCDKGQKISGSIKKRI